MGHILGDPDLGVQGSTTNSSTIIPGELSQNMMDEKRVDAASVVINQAGLWVTGGRNFKDEKNSTEIFFLDRPPIRGPDLPRGLFGHSMVQINPNTIYIIGGKFGRNQQDFSPFTWIVNNPIISNNINVEFEEGPSLIIPRKEHACAKMEINGEVFIVVAGGITNCIDDEEYYGPRSVEILNFSSPFGQWERGTKKLHWFLNFFSFL